MTNEPLHNKLDALTQRIVELEQQLAEARQQAQIERQHIRECQSRARALIDLSPDMILLHSQGTIRYINPTGARMLGATSPDEIIGQPVLDFVVPHQRNMVRQRIQQALAGKTPVLLIEEQFVRLDGSLVDVEVSAVLLTLDGTPTMQVTARDITARKQAAAALRESQQFVERIANTAPYMIYVFDRIRTFASTADMVSYWYETHKTKIC